MSSSCVNASESSPSANSPYAVLLSGGLDSAILTAALLAEGKHVQPLYVRSHLVWERAEFEGAVRFLAAIASPRLAPLVTLELPVADLYGAHWSLTGERTPDAASPDEAVFLPGRNALLVVKSAVWCQLNGVSVLALASLGTSPFGDARPDFFAHLQHALNLGGLPALRLETPFRSLNKRQVMELGRPFPLQFTFSCIAPVGKLHCGQCNKCHERKMAFREVGRADATVYANALPSGDGQ